MKPYTIKPLPEHWDPKWDNDISVTRPTLREARLVRASVALVYELHTTEIGIFLDDYLAE